MESLVVYGTTEGHTRKVAEHVADRIFAAGHRAVLHDASHEVVPALDLKSFDAVIVAASVHNGNYQAGVQWFARARHRELNALPTAFLSVSLSAASAEPEDAASLEHCIQRFTAQTGWQPPEIHHVKGALKHTQSDFLRQWALRFVAGQGGMAGGKPRDCEFTDWIGLSKFVDAFLGKTGQAATMVSPRPRQSA